MAGVGTNDIAKMGKNEDVRVEVLVKNLQVPWLCI